MFVVALFPKRCVEPCIVANIPQPLPILSYAPDAAAIADRKELSTVDQALAVDFNSTTGSTGVVGTQMKLATQATIRWTPCSPRPAQAQAKRPRPCLR